MTNPAYKCDRKRTRDKMILNKLFGNGNAIEMTNLGMLGDTNNGMNQPLMYFYDLYRQNSENPNLAMMGLAGNQMN